MRSGPAVVLEEFYSVIYDCELADLPPGHNCLVSPLPGFTLSLLEVQGRWLIATADPRLGGIARALGPGRHNPQNVRRLLLGTTKNVYDGRFFAGTTLLTCNAANVQEWKLHPCRPVAEPDLAAIRASGLYDDSLAPSVGDGTCFAAWAGDKPVALAGTVAPRALPDKVAEVSVPGTLEEWRGQGFGRTVLSHVTTAVITAGRVPLFPVSDANPASLHTARAVGYRAWGWELTIRAG